MASKTFRRTIGYLIPILLLCSLLLCSCDTSPNNGCGGTQPPIDDDANVPGEVPNSGSRRAVTADWLNKSLSIIDLDALKQGASYDDVLIGRVDLSRYSPGPIDVAVTRDGKQALVSISAGWFSVPGASAIVGDNVPSGRSTLLFVDLESLSVIGELRTGQEPMSIVFNADGSKAYVAHFGSNYVAEVDVQRRTVVDRINVGIYSEELAHDDTNTVGIVSYSASGNIRTYAVSNPADTLSRGVNLTGDAAGVAFFPNTKIAFVVQSPTPLTGMRGGYTLVDAGNPSSPRTLEDKRFANMPSCYPAVAAHNRGTVLVPITENDRAALREYRLEGNKVSLDDTIDVCNAETFGAMGLAYDAATNQAIMALPRAKLLAVTNLKTKTSFTIPWPGSSAGPADIALIP